MQDSKEVSLVSHKLQFLANCFICRYFRIPYIFLCLFSLLQSKHNTLTLCSRWERLLNQKWVRYYRGISCYQNQVSNKSPDNLARLEQRGENMCIGRVLKLTDEQGEGQILLQQLWLPPLSWQVSIKNYCLLESFFQPSCLRVKEITLYPCHFVSS